MEKSAKLQLFIDHIEISTPSVVLNQKNSSSPGQNVGLSPRAGLT